VKSISTTIRRERGKSSLTMLSDGEAYTEALHKVLMAGLSSIQYYTIVCVDGGRYSGDDADPRGMRGCPKLPCSGPSVPSLEKIDWLPATPPTPYRLDLFLSAFLPSRASSHHLRHCPCPYKQHLLLILLPR